LIKLQRPGLGWISARKEVDENVVNEQYSIFLFYCILFNHNDKGPSMVQDSRSAYTSCDVWPSTFNNLRTNLAWATVTTDANRQMDPQCSMQTFHCSSQPHSVSAS